MNFEKILVVDDDVSGRRLLEAYLRSQQFSVAGAKTLAEAEALLQQEFFDLLLVDLDRPDGNGSELLTRAARLETPPISLVLSGNGSRESVLSCLRAGAFDYITKPFALETVQAAMERAAVHRHEMQVRRYLEGELECLGAMIGNSPGIRHLRSLVERVAATEFPALIVGEKGTGKCCVAAMVHSASARANGPQVRLRCTEADETRLENELFGRITEGCEAGGGRRASHGGRLELAQGGTLVLEEVSELPLCIQIKLLEVLKEREWMRPGGEHRMGLDVRLIATTRRDLAGCVARGTFLQEFQNILTGSVLYIQPLRERIADLPLLVTDWLERRGPRCNGRPLAISEEALRHLMAYGWPGNARELENVLERATLLGEEGARLEAEAFECLSGRRGAGSREGVEEARRLMRMPFPASGEPLLTLEELEKRQVLRALEVTNQNRTRAASLLKISVRTLRNKLHQYRAEDPTLVLTLAQRRHLPLVSPVSSSQVPNQKQTETAS